MIFGQIYAIKKVMIENDRIYLFRYQFEKIYYIFWLFISLQSEF